MHVTTWTGSAPTNPCSISLNLLRTLFRLLTTIEARRRRRQQRESSGNKLIFPQVLTSVAPCVPVPGPTLNNFPNSWSFNFVQGRHGAFEVTSLTARSLEGPVCKIGLLPLRWPLLRQSRLNPSPNSWSCFPTPSSQHQAIRVACGGIRQLVSIYASGQCFGYFQRWQEVGLTMPP